MFKLSNDMIIDVRTREEYYKNHIKGSINIALHDLKFYSDFLKDKKVQVYCNSGARANIANKWLRRENIDSQVLKGNWEKDYSRVKNSIISAVNYIEIIPGQETNFQKNIKELCQKTNEVKGFLGSKLLKISGISGIGSYLEKDLTNVEIKPEKYIIITYWKDKRSHEESHKLKFFKEIYDKLPEYSSKTPYEEFYEVLK